jgi:hypothetical protein
MTNNDLQNTTQKTKDMLQINTNTAISAYHQWCCEFESRSGRGVQHYVTTFVSDLQQVGDFLRILRFPSTIIKHIKPNLNTHKNFK